MHNFMTNSPWNSPCMVCHKKNDTHTVDKLRRIETFLRQKGYEKQNAKTRYEWFLHQSCPYGLHCNELSHTRTEAEHLARKVEDMFEDLIEKQSKSDFMQALELLRGDFPSVYRCLERDFHMATKN